MENVALFPGADVPAELLLDKAKAWGLKSVVVVGEGEDGSLIYGSSIADAPNIVFLLEAMKNAVIAECMK